MNLFGLYKEIKMTIVPTSKMNDWKFILKIFFKRQLIDWTP